jgi:tetratricopeptide (TPR) repeat protein
VAHAANAFLQALKHHQAGDLGRAERLYRRTLATDPKHADSLHLLGLIAAQSSRPAYAAELIGRAIILKPHWAEAHHSLGITLRSLGRREEALSAYRRAVKLKPDYLSALINLGWVLAELGQHEKAVNTWCEVLRLSPDSAQAHIQLGVALTALGRTHEALALCSSTVHRWPDLPDGHFNFGLALQRLGRHEAAAAAYRRCIALRPMHAPALLNLGVALKEMGRHLEAVSVYRALLEIEPACAEAYSNLGVILHAVGRPEAAATALRRAIALKPHYAEAHNNLGLALADNGLLEDADHTFRRALELKPDYAYAYSNLATVQKERGDLHGAIESSQRAIELKPDYAGAHNNLGTVLKELDRSEEALACYDKAISLQAPGFESPLVNKALLLLELGQVSAAQQASDLALALNGRSGAAWHTRGELKRFSPGDPDIPRMEAVLRSADTTGLKLEDRINLEFALGKAWMDAGDADRAFEHLNAANRRRRATLLYDPVATSAWLERVAQIITPGWMHQFQGAGEPSEIPIFIVGMPRSGTSLVEQILASHPEVHGAGELTVLPRLLDELAVGKDQPAFPDAVRGLSPHELTQLGTRYVERVRGQSNRHLRLVDKMPTNFMFAGLIGAMLPNARIIHCRRDPVDTCLSCYTKNFRTGLGFAFDLRELGSFYRGYEALMGHWRASLPPDRFTEVAYEELVTDVEAEARRLLSFCGLAWDPACLEFHNTARQVRTLSAQQVRQPVYRQSIGRWRQYAQHLGPLLDSLGITSASSALPGEADSKPLR